MFVAINYKDGQIILLAEENTLMSRFEKEGQRLVCDKCGFETNSQEIFALHRKNCPRI
jgi:hypothetical protein